MKKFALISLLSASVLSAFGQASVDSAATSITSTLEGGASVVKDYAPELSLSLLSVSASVGYESQYVFRAEKFAGHSIQPKVEFAYPVYGFDIYVGAWANTPIQGTKGGLTEIDIYGGINYYYKSARVDVGYILYYYPDSDQTQNRLSRDMEVYVGGALDTSAYLWGYNLNPSAYYFYNWILKQQVVEISLSYSIPIGEQLLDDGRFTLPVTLYGGYLTSGRKNGDNGSPDSGVNYFYWGVSGDIAFAVTDYCTISGGIRYSMREGGNQGESVDHYPLQGRENNLWFGGKVDFGF